MNIVLIHPPWLRLFDAELKQPLIGLGYLAAVLEENGYKPIIYNADFNYGQGKEITNLDFLLKHERYKSILNDINHPIWQEVKEKIEYLKPDIVGIDVMTASLPTALNVATVVKQCSRNTYVVLGGHHPTVLPGPVLKCQDVDVVVRGEGEHTFLELIRNIENNNDLSDVLGISYKKNGAIFHNPARPLIPDLNTIPYPAKHLTLDIDKYPPEGFGLIIASRGCPYNCIFCASKLMWTRKVRLRSPQNVVGEIKKTKGSFKTNTFKFLDDTLTINKKQIIGICALLIQENVNIRWSCMSVVNSLDEVMLQKMAKSGCYMVSIGIETGDPETMKRIKKGITLEMVENAVKVLRKHGFLIHGYVMYGFPWETKEHIERTTEFIENLKLDSVGYSIATPLPGTELLSIVQSEGLLPDASLIDWRNLHQGSPEMFFSNKIPRDEARKILLDVETEFHDHDLKQRKKALRSGIIRHPINSVKQFFASGYHRDLRKTILLFRKLW